MEVQRSDQPDPLQRAKQLKASFQDPTDRARALKQKLGTASAPDPIERARDLKARLTPSPSPGGGEAEQSPSGRQVLGNEVTRQTRERYPLASPADEGVRGGVRQEMQAEEQGLGESLLRQFGAGVLDIAGGAAEIGAQASPIRARREVNAKVADWLREKAQEIGQLSGQAEAFRELERSKREEEITARRAQSTGDPLMPGASAWRTNDAEEETRKRNQAEAFAAAAQEDPLGALRYTSEITSRTLPSVGAMVGTGLTTGGSAPALFGAGAMLETGAQFSDAAHDPETGERRDVSARDAAAATTSGLTAGAVEAAGGKVLTSSIRGLLGRASVDDATKEAMERTIGQRLKEYGSQIARSSQAEGTTEALQGIITDVGAKYGWDPARDIGESWFEEGLVGAIAGGGATTVGAGASELRHQLRPGQRTAEGRARPATEEAAAETIQRTEPPEELPQPARPAGTQPSEANETAVREHEEPQIEVDVGMQDAVSGAQPVTLRMVDPSRDVGPDPEVAPENEVGRVTADIMGNELRITNSFVAHEADRGQGHGVRMYERLADEALERDLDLTSDREVTEQAGRMYEALERRGYNVEQHPEAQLEDVDGTQKWVAPGPVYRVTGRTEPAPTEQVEAADYGSQNRVVTKDRYEKLRERVKERMAQANTLSPEDFTLAAEMAVFHAEAGARKFGEWSQRMIDDFGEEIRPHLQGLYNRVRELEGFRAEDFDDPSTVDELTQNLGGDAQSGGAGTTPPDVTIPERGSENDPFSDLEQRLREESEAAAQGEPREVGRQELANPADRSDVRSVMDVVDQVRKEEGIPGQESMAEWREEAERRLEADYEGERRRILEGEGGMSKVEVMMAKTIISREGEQALDEGDPATVAQLGRIMNRYRERMSEAARALTSARDENLSPKERARENLMEVLFQPNRKNGGDMRSGDEEVAARAEERHAKETQEIATALKNSGIAFGQEGEVLEDPRRAAQAIRYISATRADPADVWKEYWTASILSGFTTQMVNLSTTAINTTWRQFVVRPAEMVAGSAYGSMFEGDPRAPSLEDLPHFFVGLRGSLAQAVETARLSFDTEAPMLDMDVGGGSASGWRDQAASFEVAIGGTKGRVLRFGLRALTAGDQFFKMFVFNMERGVEAYHLAKEKGLSGEAMEQFIAEQASSNSSAASQRALNAAKEATFQEEGGGLSQQARQAKSNLQRSDHLAVRLAGYALHAFVPFVRTLTNVARQGTELVTPVKMAKLVGRGVQHGLAKAEVIGGRFEYTPREGMRDAAVVAVGSLAGTGALMLASATDDEDRPYLTGTIDVQDSGARAKGYRDIPPQSILIGGTYYNYSRYAPFSFPLAFAADYVQARKQGKPMGRASAEAGVRLYRTLLESTLAAGILDAANVVGQPGRYLSKWTRRFLAGHVPNAIRSPARSSDVYFRERGSFLPDEAGLSERGVDWMRRMGQEALPLAAIQPPPIVNVWGEEAKRFEGGSPGTDFLWRITVPVRRKDSKRYAADRLLTNWRQKLGEDSWLPTAPRDAFARDGEKIQMTAKEYHDFQVRAGQMAKERVNSMIERGSINVDDPTEKAVEAVQKNIRGARRKVKNDMLRAGEFSNASEEQVRRARQGRSSSLPGMNLPDLPDLPSTGL